MISLQLTFDRIYNSEHKLEFRFQLQITERDSRERKSSGIALNEATQRSPCKASAMRNKADHIEPAQEEANYSLQ